MAEMKDFRPDTRGDVRKALATRAGLAAVAPQSPRPAHMLSSIAAGAGVTHDDLAIFELLVTLAYAEDGTMPEGRTGVEMAEVIRFLGNRCRREDVKAAFRRLKRTELAWKDPGSQRRFEGVPLLQGWHKVEGDSDLIEYELPAPVREALAAQSRYAYIELAALPPMRSKYSLAVYRRLAAMTAGHRWTPGGSNRLRVSYSADELADVIGFPRMAGGKVHGGKLKKQVLDRLPSDLAAVRNFRVTMEVRRSAARGRPVEGVDFVLDLAMPDHRHQPFLAFRRRPEPGERRIGGADCDRFRVGSALWRKAWRAYRHAFQLHGPRDMFDLWLVALDEALEGEPFTKEAYKRRARGQRLLDLIDQKGPEQAAWEFLLEEADAPDLAPDFEGGVEDYARRVEEADERRRLRVDWSALEARAKARKAKAAQKDSRPVPPPPPPPPARTPPPPPVMRAPAFLTREAQPQASQTPRQEKTLFAEKPADWPEFDPKGSLTAYEEAVRAYLADYKAKLAAAG